VQKIGEYAKQKEMEFSCLTSYFKDFTSEDKRQETIDNLIKVVDIALI
jgi:hypothetical protein